MMISVHDVAAYILECMGQMTAMKLQKLVYYSQAWALVWDEKPLFEARIEAWANGPVAPTLYARHAGTLEVAPTARRGDQKNLTRTQMDTVDAVLEFYGDKSSHWLSAMTHKERPWLEARKGLKPGEHGRKIISLASMAEFYGALT